MVTVCIFLLDRHTQISEWILYIVPVTFCVWQSRASVPLFVAAAASAFLALTFWLSPPATNHLVALSNRGVYLVAVWAVALLIQQVIRSRNSLAEAAWQRQGATQVSQAMIGEQTMEVMGARLLDTITGYLRASVGVLYLREGEKLRRIASHAYDPQGVPEAFTLGTGQIGQAARDGRLRIVEQEAHADLRISSALVDMPPRAVLIAPLAVDGTVIGMVELAFTRPARELGDAQALMEVVSEAIAIGIRSCHYRSQLAELLERTQRQSEELQVQQEELRVSNEELSEQGNVLRASQSRLENQQAELEQSNEVLAERTHQLERQKTHLLSVQKALEDNASELERSNRYKSEFLANMSHELRTPLNSSLILSRLLAENKSGHLSDEEIRYANTIHAANGDLLDLINEILDLAKIEAGRLDISLKEEPVARITSSLAAVFEGIARQKRLGFRIDVDPSAPDVITTDLQRLQQVLRNLLSNAFKFTDAGEVRLQVSAPEDGWIVFAVQDTGCGIEQHQLGVIFEPFRQADGTTSRKYGGTGLGLSISRELAQLLGGTVEVTSEPDAGSTFTLRLPVLPVAPAQATSADVADAPASRPAPVSAAAASASRIITQPDLEAPRFVAQIDDDRNKPPRAGRTILVVEDDLRFAQVLYDLAHELDFDCVHTSTAGAALRLAEELQPVGILLDINLPDESGLTVLERLKHNSATRHIQIHMVSVHDHRQTALKLGAVGYAIKPVAREELADAMRKLEERLKTRLRRVLVVEDDETLRENIGRLIGAEDVETVLAGTMSDALAQLSKQSFDCMVMDLTLPDASGYDLLERMTENAGSFPPVIVYTGRALTRAEEDHLRRYSASIIIKGARSPERLLDEVSLFLHRVEADLPPDKQRLLQQARQRDSGFEGRRILLVEDDMRNVFALTAVIENLGAKLEVARNGREGVDMLDGRSDIDLVLMDIMMPEMDGITAMRTIRRNPVHSRLPIIALTAKAMQDDRQHCLQAGANDYIPKPVDIDKLVSLCRIWLPQ
ncbi:hybrid sensor histidine kinase/response regulator [Uliginosibacterium sp. H1]|uniref:hybrid sensor histidine kinase/response regulator n=1 Tax=Uliginosibacterium sp. H1 TaxID=3114757 RepID=UPI002E16C478|nr:response regulator [Uliginosibacterium sp. H1]